MQFLLNYWSEYSPVHTQDSQTKADGCDDKRDGLKAAFYVWAPHNTTNKYLSCGKLWLFPLPQSLTRLHLKFCFVLGFGPLTPRQTLRCWRVCREGQQSWGRVCSTSLMMTGARGAHPGQKEAPSCFLQLPDRREEPARDPSLLQINKW